MYYEKLPYGLPIHYQGEYEYDCVYDLYIQHITCSFEIKKDKIPCIQIKEKNSCFVSTEYIKSTYNEKMKCYSIEHLMLTNVDLELFLEQYEVYNLEYVEGWKFKSKLGMFTGYIDKWMNVKKEATKNGNKGLRTLAKLMLNSLYGKLATSLITKSKNPFLGEDDIVHYIESDEREKKGFYLPAGVFITSYGRNKTIRTCQKIMDYSIKKYGKNKFIYADTDSAHCLLTKEELDEIVEIDDVELGKWAIEGEFEKARFIRQKTYIECFKRKVIKIKKYKTIKIKAKKNKGYLKNKEYNNLETKITCAGMGKGCYKFINWNNFRSGLKVKGDLKFKHVVGGVKLEPTEYTIKENNLKKNIENFDV